mgnify:CR=1 FL=1
MAKMETITEILILIGYIAAILTAIKLSYYIKKQMEEIKARLDLIETKTRITAKLLKEALTTDKEQE